MKDPNYKYFQLTEMEDLILEKEDWEDEEWKTIIKIFNNNRDVERIVIKSPYKIQGYGTKNDRQHLPALWYPERRHADH